MSAATQCQCCASQLGETVAVNGVVRVVCNNCLGFMARWLIEMENAERLEAQRMEGPGIVASLAAMEPTNQERAE